MGDKKYFYIYTYRASKMLSVHKMSTCCCSENWHKSLYRFERLLMLYKTQSRII